MGAGAIGILPEFRRFVRMKKKKINATPPGGVPKKKKNANLAETMRNRFLFLDLLPNFFEFSKKLPRIGEIW